jgi:guanosine-3',5'-bis(diphosphate) 3'-pyrophosphohydrolase
LVKAYDFAAFKHRNQKRKNAEQTPYINHPIGLVRILTEAGVFDVNVLIGAILHDTVEDTDTTLEEIEKKFGPYTRELVASVSDDKSLPKAERKRLQVEHARQSSLHTRLIKMADKIHNLTDLTTCQPTWWTPQRVQGYFVWSKSVTDACYGNTYGPQTGGKYSPASGSGYKSPPIDCLWWQLNKLYQGTFKFENDGQE